MKIKYRKGNLIELFDKGEFGCIAHQCNTLIPSEQSEGITKLIFGKYSRASHINNYTLVEKRNNRHELLGDVSIGEKQVLNGLIFNLYAQYNPGPPSKGIDSLECRLNYLKECFYKVRDSMYMKGYTTLAIPLIATGVVKGILYPNLNDREYFNKIILPTIKKVFIETNVEITIVYSK